MTSTKTLDIISGRLFLLGFFASKLKATPILLVSAIFNIVSLAAYLVGYIVWFVASLFYPPHKRQTESWYGFAQFKDQFQAAALIGTAATILCIIAPTFILPAAWFYVISNTLWSIGEYHKKASPSQEDKEYSSAKQAIYFRYTLLVTSSSLIGAAASTIALIYPATAMLLIPASTTVVMSLILISTYYWAECSFGDFPPDQDFGHNKNFTTSTAHMAPTLGVSAKGSNKVVSDTPYTPLFSPLSQNPSDFSSTYSPSPAQS